MISIWILLLKKVIDSLHKSTKCRSLRKMSFQQQQIWKRTLPGDIRRGGGRM